MSMARRPITVFLLCGLLAALPLGCGDDDDDAPVPAGGSVEGDYTIALTNRDNGCGFEWTEGESTSGIRLDLTEKDGGLTGEITGQGSALVLTLALGSGGNVLEGTANGGRIELTRLGMTSFHEGDCTYTLNATLAADISGDIIQGSIRYTAATNDNPDCSDLEGCISRQDFNGTRPPT
jgi:hypothetical protein